MRFPVETSEMQFDVRTVGHRLRRGEISQAQYNAFLESLPDEGEEGEEAETEFTAVVAQRRAADAQGNEDAGD